MSKILIRAFSKFMEKGDAKRLAEQNYDWISIMLKIIVLQHRQS